MASAELDPGSNVPLYRQIQHILREEILSGRLDAQEPMTEEKLLARFEVSRAPIRQALGELVSEGYVYRKQGRGTFPVSGARVERPADLRAGNLFSYLDDQGLHPSSEVHGITREQPPAEVARRLMLGEDDRALTFTRWISVDGRPLADNRIYMRVPEEFVPTEEELRDGGSAFALLERDFGLVVERAEHEAWATAATPEQAESLQVDEGSPLLVVDTVFYARGGLPAGWRRAVHHAEQFKFRFVTNA